MTEKRFAHWADILLVAAGGFSALIGFVVLLGWRSHNNVLRQVLPDFVPMQYDAAWGFLLCGIGFLAVVFGWPMLALVTGAMVGFLSLLALSQQLFHPPVWIDPFLVQLRLLAATHPVGPMPPTAALCFLMTGSALALISRSRDLRQQPLLLGVLGFVILGLGMVCSFGYLGENVSPHQWGETVGIALQSGMGFFVLGAGLIIFAWSRALIQGVRFPRWIPFFVGASVLMVTLLLWQALRTQEETQLRRMVQLGAEKIENNVREQLKIRILTLIRMANRWEVRGAPTRKEWESDAEMTLDHLGSYQSIGWADPSFHLRWVVPPTGEDTAQDKNLEMEKAHRLPMEDARDHHGVVAGPPVDVPGGRGFRVYVPIFVENWFSGWIIGSFLFKDLGPLLVDPEDSVRYAVTIANEREKIYQDPAGVTPRKGWGHEERNLNLYGIPWKIRVWPKPELPMNVESPLPGAMLMIGILLSFLTGLAVALVQAAWARSKELGVTAKKLEREIEERRTAELSRAHLEEELRQKVAQLAKSNADLVYGAKVMQGLLKNLQVSKQELETQALALRNANERLKGMGDLKDEFVAKVSHELRTPLTSIKEGLSLLLDGALGETTTDQKDFLKTMDADIDRLTELINNMLDVSKIESGRMRLNRQRVNVTELIRSTIRSYQAIKGRRTVMEHLQPVPDLFVDSNRILQVLGNLFSNAVKYGKEDGTIEFAVEPRDGTVAVMVRDNGEGIAPEDLPKLFQKFSQVGRTGTNQPRGTGLGLVVCKELVELHGGRIEVSSQVGVGTTFTVVFSAYSDSLALKESFLELKKECKEGVGIGLIAVRCAFAEGLDSSEKKQQIQRFSEEVRARLHRGDIVLNVEPAWIVVCAATEPEGVQAIIHRFSSAFVKQKEIFFGAAFCPTDGTDPLVLLEIATRRLKEGSQGGGVLPKPVVMP